MKINLIEHGKLIIKNHTYIIIFHLFENTFVLLYWIKNPLHPPALPNIRDKFGQTALHWAINNPAKVKLLLKYGADRSIDDNEHKTALNDAVNKLKTELDNAKKYKLEESIKVLMDYTPELKTGGSMGDNNSYKNKYLKYKKNI